MKSYSSAIKLPEVIRVIISWTIYIGVRVTEHYTYTFYLKVSKTTHTSIVGIMTYYLKRAHHQVSQNGSFQSPIIREKLMTFLCMDGELILFIMHYNAFFHIYTYLIFKILVISPVNILYWQYCSWILYNNIITITLLTIFYVWTKYDLIL